MSGFNEEKGKRFFKSTLIQTLFYGIFSAWVLWHKQDEEGKFDWRTAGYYLRVPMIQALFDKMATSQNLRRLDLVEVLDWTMEEAGKNNRMVKQNFQPEHTPISPSDGSENLSTTINFSEISKLSKLSFDPDAVPIWELVAEISAQVPDEEWQKLPTDLAGRFDYYQKQKRRRVRQ